MTPKLSAPIVADYNITSYDIEYVQLHTDRSKGENLDVEKTHVLILTSIIALFFIMWGIIATGDPNHVLLLSVCIAMTMIPLVIIYFIGELIIRRWHINESIKKLEAFPQRGKVYLYIADSKKYEDECLRIRYINQAKIREQERLKREEQKNEKQKQYTYWSSLDPYKFEIEIAALYQKLGYTAEVTKGSGDGGIDIVLSKDGTNGIVQCKRYNSKVGPATIRDLYGTMQHGKWRFGYVVCPAGFSAKAFEFSKNKNIKLIGFKRIMEMVEI